MGIELLIGAAVAAVSVATGVMQMQAAKKANAARKEAGKVTQAQQKNEAADSRRKAIREARVRRAQIMQASENAGLGQQGSGMSGAISAVNTNLGSASSAASGQSLAIQGINSLNQKAADYDFQGAQWGAFGNIFASAAGAFTNKDSKGNTIFSSMNMG